MVAATYLVLLLPPYLPFLLGKVLYQGDIFIYFEPVIRYVVTSVTSGQFPLWNPFILCGSPQAAISSPGLFYPPNWLFLMVPFGYGLSLAMLFHQWLFGTCTYLFLRLTTGCAYASLFGGAAALLCGYMFGCAQCYTLGATFAWTPLALSLIRMSTKDEPMRYLSLFALVLGLQILAGRPEIFLGAGLVYVCYALMIASVEEKSQSISLSFGIKWLLSFALALTGGVAIASPALLPLLELYSVSPRAAGLDYSEIARWSAGWFDWLQVFLAQPFGDLIVANFHLNPNYPGLYPYISSLFLGVPLICVSIIGLTTVSWKERAFWLPFLVFFFILSSGEFGFILPLWYKMAPGTLVFRYPIKMAVFVLFVLLIAAAWGLRALKEDIVKRSAIVSIAALCAVAAALCLLLLPASGSLIPFIWPQHALISLDDGTRIIRGAFVNGMISSLLGLAAMFVVLRAMQSKADEKAKAHSLKILSLLCFVPMMVSGALHLWHFADADFYSDNSLLTDWLKSRPDISSYRMLSLLPDELLAPASYWNLNDAKKNSVSCSKYEREILEPNVNMDARLPSAYGFGPTETGAYHALYLGVTTRSSIYAPPRLAQAGAISDAPLAALCQITNTRYVFTATNKPDSATHVIQSTPILDPRHFEQLKEFPALNLRAYAVKDALPRAFFRRQWTPVENQRLSLAYLFAVDRSFFHPEDDVLINNEGDWTSVPNPPPADLDYVDDSKVSLVKETPQSVEIKAAVNDVGFLVLSDLDYPGWICEDNGAPRHIYQANGFLRAVYLEPGQHNVVFRYVPGALYEGLALSSFTLLLVASAYALSSYRSGRQTASKE